MIVSLSSLLTAVLFSSLLIVVCYIFLRRADRLMSYGFVILSISVLAILFRIALPIEFAFTRTIPIGILYPVIWQTLYRPLGSWGITGTHIAMAVWIVVSLMKAMIAIVQYRRFCATIDELRTSMVRTTIHLNQRHKEVKIVSWPGITNAFAFGLTNPIIILPALPLSKKEREYILQHELSHIIAGDLWIKLAVDILVILYWWNPLVYLLRRNITDSFEIQADWRTTRDFDVDEKGDYLNCILRIAKKKVATNRYAIPLVGNRKNVLVRRFLLVADERKPSFKKICACYLSFIMMLAFLFTASFSVVFESYKISEVVQKNTFSITQGNSFLVRADDGYDLYLSDEYAGTIHKIPDSFSSFIIYDSLLEVEGHGTN